jgi:hypothetical protein
MLTHGDLNVVILAYSRVDTFERVIRECEKKLNHIKVVMDFPENDLVSKRQQEMIEILDSLKISYDLRRRQENYGLVRSVLTTIKEELEDNEHIILLEDDCLPMHGFFEYMNDSLTKHKDNKNISTVCGTITKCRFNPWGWATWSNKWNYQQLSKDEILEISNLDDDLRCFLESNNVENSIWSLSWLANQYKDNTNSIFPEHNLIQNIGLDESGVHSHKKGYTNWLLSQIKEK